MRSYYYVLRVGKTAARLSYEFAIDSFRRREKAEAEAYRLNGELSRCRTVQDTLTTIVRAANLSTTDAEKEFQRLSIIVEFDQYKKAALIPLKEDPRDTLFKVLQVDSLDDGRIIT